MKLLVILFALGSITGCASNRPINSQAISYEQLDTMGDKMTNRDCPMIDYHINYIEQQLRYKNLYNREPETMEDSDRKYNAKAHVIIWGLRIGCNNLDRYKK